MKASLTRSLQQRLLAFLRQDLAQLLGDTHHVGEPSRARIEVEEHEVRLVEILHARKTDVESECALVHEVEERLQIVDERVLHLLAFFAGQLDSRDPLGVVDRRVLLSEMGTTRNTLRQALQRDGSIAQM